jgi:transcriptional regulator with XRE-family HTH domain
MAWFEQPRDPQQLRGFDLIGGMVKRRRVALGWSQRYLEGQCGVDQAVISRLENGKQYGLRWSRFAELVDALGGLEVVAPAPRPGPAGAATMATEDPLELTPSEVIDLATGLDPGPTSLRRRDGVPITSTSASIPTRT